MGYDLSIFRADHANATLATIDATPISRTKCALNGPVCGTAAGRSVYQD
jgi:hypothetical protein